MKHYKKLAAGVLGIELFFIMAANVFYYMAAVTREPRIERAQEKTDTIYKIIYTQTDYGTWIFMDIVLGIMFLLSVFFVCYVGEKVIRPFQNMQNLTEELAKGNLSTPIKAEKSRFFGRFLWGMDMLRDTLESNRKKELELQKEAKKKTPQIRFSPFEPATPFTLRFYSAAQNACWAVKLAHDGALSLNQCDERMP